MNWDRWHLAYEHQPALRQRLQMVREHIAACIGHCPPGPITLLSLCAGDGRDVLGAVANHDRRGDVNAALLDTHAESLERGRAMAADAGLERQVRFIRADAGLGRSYCGLVPADVVIVSGMLGHLRHDDALRLMASLPTLCRRDARLVWSRHATRHDGRKQVPRIRSTLERSGFAEIDVCSPAGDGFAVACCRFNGEPMPLDLAGRLFEFVGLDRLDPPQGRRLRGDRAEQNSGNRFRRGPRRDEV